jgi:hypothetical protein
MSKTTQILVAIVAFIALLAGGLMIYSGAQHKAYLISKGESAVLEKQFADYRLTSEKEKTALTAEAIRTTAEKDAAIAAANAADASKAAIQSALDAEKAKTAAMPADTLSGNINQRIGAGQSWPTAGGVFTFTRPGTESVLNRFLDGEASEGKYQAEMIVTLNLRTALGKSEGGAANLGTRLTLTQGELDKCVAAKDANAKALSHLEHSITGTAIKNLAIGAAGYIVAEKVVIPLVKLIFGIK